jgi:hypothetical protein
MPNPYPLHHQCSHFRGYLSSRQTRCLNCTKRDRVEDRRRIYGHDAEGLSAEVRTWALANGNEFDARETA